MWLITNETDVSLLIRPNKEHIVSRTSGFLTLNDDKSISRQHAKLLLNSEDVNADCGIILADTSSKYGTYVNEGIEYNTRIPTNGVVLKHNDVVRFGLQYNKFRVLFMPIIVTTSNIKKPEKQIIKRHIETLGGTVISYWSPQCTHITMNKIIITVKLVSALAAGQHIVTPEYWSKLLLAIETKQAILPDPSDHIPKLNEPTLNETNVSFKINKARSLLFKSLIFVAPTINTVTHLEPMITSAGGRIVDLYNCKLNKEDFSKDNIILIQHTQHSSSQSSESQLPSIYNNISEYLISKGLRCIPESEIGLSIVYCSRDTYCNPKFATQSLFEFNPAALKQTESASVIVQETEDAPPAEETLGAGKIINETVAAGVSRLSGDKNKRLSNLSDLKESKEEKLIVSNIENLPTISCSVSSAKIIDKRSITLNTNPTGSDSPKPISQTNLNKNTRKRMVISDDEDEIRSHSPNQKKFHIDNDDSFSFPPKEKQITKSLQLIDSKQDDFKCIFMNNDSSNKSNNNIFSKTNYNKNDKKRGVISDDEEENDFCLPSEKKTRVDISNKISDDEDGFSLPSDKKRTSKVASRQINSERDIFDVSEKSNKNIFSKTNYNKTDKKRMVISDDEGENNFCLPSEKKARVDISNKISDDEDGFLLPSDKKRTSKVASGLTNSDRDIFDVSHISESVECSKSSNDLFKSLKTPSNIKQKETLSLTSEKAKRSGDIFDSTQKSDDAEDIDNDFQFSIPRKKNQPSNSCTNSNSHNNSKIVFNNPFIIKKSSKNELLFDEDSSDCRTNKRRISIDEPSPKKLTTIKVEVDDDGSNFIECNQNYSNYKLQENIKKESTNTIIKDEGLHDSTVVIIKSLIVPFRQSLYLEESRGKENIKNFKKFRKSTPFKPPQIVEVVPYKEDISENSHNIAYNIDTSSEEEDNDSWAFQRTQALKKNRSKVKK